MSDGKRFWVSRGWDHHNYTTHREIGIIPGCVPAVDVLIERTPEQAQHITHLVAQRYIRDMRTMNYKEFINQPIEKAAPAFRNL